MAYAIVMSEYGGPEVLRRESITVGFPGKGELRLRQTCLGVNFHDIYVRTGLYKTLALPGIPGIEGVGIVEEVGDEVVGFAPGDRVAYITDKYGCYASERILPAAIAVRLPDTIDDALAAAVFLKALTVEMLLRHVCDVNPGDWILVHAAAGGVGRLLCQWGNAIGARVIGTAGSHEKADIARRAGCSDVILYREENFVERVKAITDARGVDVAYDSVGKDTFFGSLQCLAYCGHLVNFGQSSGPPEPVAMSQLLVRSSTISRPSVFHYAAQRSVLDKMATAVFTAIVNGWLQPEEAIKFPLESAHEAHALLQSRTAVCPIVLAA